MILQLSFKLSTVNSFVMKKLENKETCFSKRRESCYFPSRKTRAVHGLEARFPAKKDRILYTTRHVRVSDSPPSLPESVRALVRVLPLKLPVVCELFGVQTQLMFADCFSSSKGKRNFHKGLTYVYNVASESLDLNLFRSSE